MAEDLHAVVVGVCDIDQRVGGGDIRRIVGPSRPHTSGTTEGLLPPPPRTPGGYRDYAADALDDLSFIRKAQALGFRLSEVREVLAITAEGRAPCDHVRAAVLTRLDEVERRMNELRELRTTLSETLARLDRDQPPVPGCRCTAIEAHG